MVVQSSMSIDKDIYIAAGLSTGGKLPDGNLVDGSWGYVPFGCSVTSHVFRIEMSVIILCLVSYV